MSGSPTCREGCSRLSIPPGLRTAGLAIAGCGLVLLPSGPALVAAAAASAVLSIARLGFRAIRGACPPLVLVGLLSIGLAAALSDGLGTAVETVLRLSALLFLAHLYAATTRPTDLQEVVAAVLRPLERARFVRADTVGLAFALALTSIPRIQAQYRELRDAQAARGARVGQHRLLIPLIVRIVRDADEIGAALDARGWSGAKRGDHDDHA